MKKYIIYTTIIFAVLSLSSCQQTTGRYIINDPFPEAQMEITKTLDDIYKSAQNKEFDLLRSFHLYGPKFTEFKNGEPRANSEQNKRSEEELFTSLSDFEYDLRDLKVSVYGDVAIATFHGHFEANMGEQHLSFQLQSTLAFVKTENSWKIVHEHFSPLNLTELNQNNN